MFERCTGICYFTLHFPSPKRIGRSEYGISGVDVGRGEGVDVDTGADASVSGGHGGVLIFKLPQSTRNQTILTAMLMVLLVVSVLSSSTEIIAFKFGGLVGYLLSEDPSGGSGSYVRYSILSIWAHVPEATGEGGTFGIALLQGITKV